ncbi:sulfite exporter TauE/SafE family protein [Capnocytophaga canimorsus]|uniref:sulfite exporter TauE/SafE family protein n=1 Tax=Capnocytophaga canimorsus TaxID=28188 RepID=UPI0037D57139
MIYTAFILGFLGSFHCVGMCGPLTLLLPLHHKHPLIKALQIVAYHLGKALTYTTLGLVFGLLGKGLFIRDYQQTFSILVGILMILIVILPLFKIKLSFFDKPIYLWVGKIKHSLGKELRNKSAFSTFTIGLFNGFLPCGLVYMALFGALAQDTLPQTLLYMFVFGLGTVPLLTVAIYLGNFLSNKTKRYVQKSVPVFIIIMGILFILRGAGIGIPYVSPSNMNLMIKANPDCVIPAPILEENQK